MCLLSNRGSDKRHTRVQKFQEIRISYRQTIIQAVQDVDTANSSYAAQRDRVRKLNDAVLASQQAVTLASERYDRGLTDFLNVLDAEREEYTLEDQYAVAEQTAALKLVALYKPSAEAGSRTSRCRRSTVRNPRSKPPSGG